ncbi:N-acetylglucosamine-6-phosphate deacetylase, partial [Vibrio parahaemolyticus]|nr:N-acetylglucosamine-6-phosphate deacetylase [Vibrio parahaemolyticus]
YHNKYQNQSLGLHLEGPYLNVAKKGIHNVDFIRPSDESMIDLICANADIVAKVTLAPEHNDPEHIARLKAAGIVVSIGHTNATYTEARKSFAAGITSAT